MKVFLSVFLMAMVPVLELRAAIPLGIAMNLPPVLTYIAAVLGNMVPVPFIIMLIESIFKLLKKSELLGPKIEALEKRAHIKGRLVRKYSLLGLLILVAIPLPGTGAWTGSLVAALLDLDYRKAIPVIFAGVLISGLLVMALSLSVAAVV